jgi:hypothetical protein
VTRQIDAATGAAVVAPVVRLALLVELQFASGTSRLWSGLGDFAWNGVTFAGVGDLLGVSAIEETAEVRSVGTTLQLSGLPTSAIGMLAETERWQNRIARLWLAVFEADGITLAGEPVPLARARMDQLSYEEGETATFTLTLESRLADLERPRVRRYTNADQQAEYPGDRGFEFVESVAAGKKEVVGW